MLLYGIVWMSFRSLRCTAMSFGSVPPPCTVLADDLPFSLMMKRGCSTAVVSRLYPCSRSPQSHRYCRQGHSQGQQQRLHNDPEENDHRIIAVREKCNREAMLQPRLAILATQDTRQMQRCYLQLLQHRDISLAEEHPLWQDTLRKEHERNRATSQQKRPYNTVEVVHSGGSEFWSPVGRVWWKRTRMLLPAPSTKAPQPQPTHFPSLTPTKRAAEVDSYERITNLKPHNVVTHNQSSCVPAIPRSHNKSSKPTSVPSAVLTTNVMASNAQQ